MIIQVSKGATQKWRTGFAFAAGLAMMQAATAQTPLPLQDLSFFKTPGATWSVASAVKADLSKPGALIVTPGTGILVNNPAKEKGVDLYTGMEHGDIDLLALAADTPDRRRRFYVSEPWWWWELSLLTRENARIRSSEDLRAKSLALAAPAYRSTAEEVFPEANLILRGYVQP